MAQMQVTAIISAGQALSEAIDCSAGAPVFLHMPAEWTSARVSFQVSPDGANFNDLFGYDAREVTFNVIAGTSVRLDSVWEPVTYVKVRSGGRDAPVPQDADREIIIGVQTLGAPDVVPPETPEVPADAIPDAPSDGLMYVRLDGAWVPMPSGFSMMFEFMFDHSVSPPPVNSQLRLNHTDPAQATMIWLNNNDANGMEVSNLLSMVDANFTVFLQFKNDPDIRATYTSTGPAFTAAGFTEIPVTYVSGSGAPSDNQRFLVVVYGGG